MPDVLGPLASVGRYRLLTPIGRGAHGTVYQAEQQGPGALTRTVALKVLTDDATGLWHEARLGGLLRHPHLVDVYEVGEADGHVFCAMEWCEGGALSRWAPLPPQAVVDAGLQACAALAYAHEQLGIVHLDIKPANLLLSREGVKVGDWGIARAQGRVPISGTRGFMPPEQLRGDPVDARADVYALGVTLARLALGDEAVSERTYDPSTGALPTLYLTAQHVIDAGGAEVTVPEWLREVVNRCVRADPAERWPSMHAVAEALGRVEVSGPGLRELIGDEPPATRTVTLFGRDDVVADTLSLLARPRALVTLKGPPGVGKSQIARGVAEGWEAEGKRVVWCDLDGVERLDDALQLLGRSLGLPASTGAQRDALDRIGRVLQTLGDTLVVFDDVGRDLEQPEDLGRWDAGPQVRWLATSRHPLHIPGEQPLEVPPLPLAACREVFWAAAQRRGVAPTPHDDLDALCERLDRLPLALELAAGRLGVLTLDEVIANSHLSFLRSGRRGRHATLHAALDESWGLLTPAQRRALQTLAAFDGTVRTEAMRFVLHDVLDEAAALSQRSLIRTTPRWVAVLAVVKDYVREVGTDRHEAECRHGAYYAGFGDPPGRAAAWSHGGHRRWAMVADDLDDVHLACLRAVERGDRATATSCLRAWWSVAARRGPFQDGVVLARAVDSLGDLSPADEAAVATVRGHAERLSGALEPAVATLDRALALAKAHDLAEEGLEAAVAWAGAGVSLGRAADAYSLLEHWVERAEGRVPMGLLALGLAQWGSLGGHPGAARAERLARAAALARTSGHRRPEGMALQVLAALDHMGGRREEAERRYRAALRVFDEIDDRRFTAIVSCNLAMLLAAGGAHGPALDALQGALKACLDMGDRRQELIVRIALGEVQLQREDGVAALPHLEQARALAHDIGIRQRAAVATLGLAKAWALQGDAGRAQQALDEAARLPELHPAEQLVARADVAWSLGRRDDAAAWLAQARVEAEDIHGEYIAQLEARMTGR